MSDDDSYGDPDFDMGDVSDMSDDYEAEQSDDFSEESDVESYYDDESSDEFIVRRGPQGKSKSRTLTERVFGIGEVAPEQRPNVQRGWTHKDDFDEDDRADGDYRPGQPVKKIVNPPSLPANIPMQTEPISYSYSTPSNITPSAVNAYYANYANYAQPYYYGQSTGSMGMTSGMPIHSQILSPMMPQTMSSLTNVNPNVYSDYYAKYQQQQQSLNPGLRNVSQQFVVRPEDVLRIQSMGFGKEMATKALNQNRGNTQRAIQWLLQQQMTQQQAQSRVTRASARDTEYVYVNAPGYEYESDPEPEEPAVKSERAKRLEKRRKQVEKKGNQKEKPEKMENDGTDDSDVKDEESVEEERKKSRLEQLIDACTEMSDTLSTNIEELQTAVDAKDFSIFEAQPEGMASHCVMTDYQLYGLNWLYLLNKQNMNGILADEMGLGKTIQTISLFTLLKAKGKNEKPHLIVVPSSTMSQWKEEFEKWSPGMHVEMYQGSQDERYDMHEYLLEGNYDILLMSYPVVNGKMDRPFLKRMKFGYMVLDEAQNIKNQESKRYKVLFSINTDNRLLLTGTPLQNNLEELWALLTFIMPTLFKRLKLQNYKEVFKINRSQKNGKKQEARYIKTMKKILKPFILRRLKQHVTLDLPKKTTKIIECEMTEKQKELYTRIYANSKSVWEKHMKEAEKSGKSAEALLKKRGVVEEEGKTITMHSFLNNILMQLRKTANHPILIRAFYDDEQITEIAQVLKDTNPENDENTLEEVSQELRKYSDWELHKLCYHNAHLEKYRLTLENILESSGKFVVLKKMLTDLKASGKRVLLFSQMTKMLDLLEVLVEDEGWKHVRLDGSTSVSERQDLIDTYNNDPECFLFLLSTRAGGLGINLTSADTVIFYDISFNPQVDRQAEDRCHRLGQTKKVTIYKLIVSQSCEEHILQMASEKKELNDVMLGEGKFDTGDNQDITNDLIMEMFNLKKRRRRKKGKSSKSSKSSKSTKTRRRKTKKTRSSKKRKREDSSEDEPPIKKKRRVKKRTTRSVIKKRILAPELDNLNITKESND